MPTFELPGAAQQPLQRRRLLPLTPFLKDASTRLYLTHRTEAPEPYQSALFDQAVAILAAFEAHGVAPIAPALNGLANRGLRWAARRLHQPVRFEWVRTRDTWMQLGWAAASAMVLADEAVHWDGWQEIAELRSSGLATYQFGRRENVQPPTEDVAPVVIERLAPVIPLRRD